MAKKKSDSMVLFHLGVNLGEVLGLIWHQWHEFHKQTEAAEMINAELVEELWGTFYMELVEAIFEDAPLPSPSP